MTASSADWWHRQKIPLPAELSASFSGDIPFARPLSVTGFLRQSFFRFFDLPKQHLTDVQKSVSSGYQDFSAKARCWLER